MSDWANYVIVPERGEHEVYESRFGAVALGLDLLPGPDVTLPFIRSRDVRNRWHDDIWCEAAVLVDLRRKVLLFFVGEGPPVSSRLRCAYGDVLRHAWAGWEVRWTYDGPAELREYLGLDPKTVRIRDRQVLPGAVVGLGDAELSEPDPLVSLVTIGTDRCHMISDDGDHPITEGPALLDRLAGAPDHGICPFAVQSGIHIDPARRQVAWWLLDSQPEAYDMAARWPGWRIVFWQDRWQEHVRASGGRLIPPPVNRAQALAEVKNEVREHWSQPHNVELAGPALAAIDAAWQLAHREESKTVQELLSLSTEPTTLDVADAEKSWPGRSSTD